MSRFPYDAPDRDERDEEGSTRDGYVTCNRCSQGPFTWLHTGVRWRLVDDRNRFHECTGVKPDDFEDLA